ncbi:putative isopentenyl phosphate kinase [Helianthus annuus]|nr:putative isopentenyl phosphate kinase [Helianthus annuus]
MCEFIGGAAITCKNEFEKINEANLVTVSSQLREAMMMFGSSSGSVLEMDWSKRPGVSETPKKVDDFKEQQQGLDYNSFVVIHGAGQLISIFASVSPLRTMFRSFGHFQASKSGVHKGGLNQPLVKAGFVATRISVTSLNLEIVRALAREGIPSVAMSPFSCGWSTRDRNIASADVSTVVEALDSGFVPVLHGDAVLDESLGCTILSGDLIISHLAAHLKPQFVVFLVSSCFHFFKEYWILIIPTIRCWTSTVPTSKITTGSPNY